MIDLHVHSTASDGTDTPADLVARAAAAGLRVVAITDHDTTAGWQQASDAVSRIGQPLMLLRGTEFSCFHQTASGRRISMHLLGYLYDPDSPQLRTERATLRASRLGRGEAIVANLSNAGYPISWPDVVDIAGGGAVGRPHIGAALVRAGVVGSVDEAFADLLSNQSPHYVPKQDMLATRAIELIRDAGGVPVIAHPWARARGAVLDEQDLADLVAAGMLGIETQHPDHLPADRARLTELAAELGVFGTGSSDYHGSNKATAIGAESTEPAELARLLSHASGIEPVVHS